MSFYFDYSKYSVEIFFEVTISDTKLKIIVIKILIINICFDVLCHYAICTQSGVTNVVGHRGIGANRKFTEVYTQQQLLLLQSYAIPHVSSILLNLQKHTDDEGHENGSSHRKTFIQIIFTATHLEDAQ